LIIYQHSNKQYELLQSEIQTDAGIMASSITFDQGKSINFYAKQWELSGKPPHQFSSKGLEELSDKCVQLFSSTNHGFQPKAIVWSTFKCNAQGHNSMINLPICCWRMFNASKANERQVDKKGLGRTILSQCSTSMHPYHIPPIKKTKQTHGYVQTGVYIRIL